MAPKIKTALVSDVLDALEEARKKLGLSREDFCKKAEMSYQTWMYWQKGDTSPNLVTLGKLLTAHHLHLTILTEAQRSEGAAHSDDTRFIANLVQLMPPAMRAEVRNAVLEKLQRALETHAISAPPALAELAPPEPKKK